MQAVQISPLPIERAQRIRQELSRNPVSPIIGKRLRSSSPTPTLGSRGSSTTSPKRLKRSSHLSSPSSTPKLERPQRARRIASTEQKPRRTPSPSLPVIGKRYRYSPEVTCTTPRTQRLSLREPLRKRIRLGRMRPVPKQCPNPRKIELLKRLKARRLAHSLANSPPEAGTSEQPTKSSGPVGELPSLSQFSPFAAARAAFAGVLGSVSPHLIQYLAPSSSAPVLKDAAAVPESPSPLNLLAQYSTSSSLALLPTNPTPARSAVSTIQIHEDQDLIYGDGPSGKVEETGVQSEAGEEEMALIDDKVIGMEEMEQGDTRSEQDFEDEGQSCEDIELDSEEWGQGDEHEDHDGHFDSEDVESNGDEWGGFEPEEEDGNPEVEHYEHDVEIPRSQDNEWLDEGSELGDDELECGDARDDDKVVHRARREGYDLEDDEMLHDQEMEDFDADSHDEQLGAVFFGDIHTDAAYQDMLSGPKDSLPTRRHIAALMRLIHNSDRGHIGDQETPSRGSSPTSHQPAVKNLDIRHSSPQKLELKRDIRHFIAELMELHTLPVKVVSRETADRFAHTKRERDGPVLNDLHLDLTGSLASPWNKRAAALVAQRFVADPAFSCKDHKQVEAAFRAHLPTLRERYQKGLRGARGDINDEYEQELRDRKRKKSRENRRRSLRHRRKEACDTYKRDPSMQRFLPIWKKLPFEAMSGDETDHENFTLRYVITNLPWRSDAPEITTWFKTFDHLHMSTRFTSNDRATPGKFPHPRIMSRRLETHDTPVPGLPINFYNARWIQSLDPFERDKLDVQPPLDLTFTQNILNIARRFKHVVDRTTPPIPRNA